MLSVLSANVMFLLLHITQNGSFPKPLSKDEEKHYLELSATGDIEARNILIERNLRLVVHIIKKYYSSSADHDDLISIGTIGLIKAISTFDCSKNTRLATYASRCIENEILMYFRSQKKSASDVSLNESLDNESESSSLSLMDVVSCEDDMLENVDLAANIRLLHKYMNSELTGREKRIICMRYGIGGVKALTQHEIAKKLDISRSYVSRIEKKALTKLQSAFNNRQF
ncbi:MAG: RNA polymerase sporulation sigma factor SigK [Clostridia bacterium]|nr:RNA polymerase sporulation sigma factor SigK [Clostridia bacterium]MBR3870827.1 RNA polymerase sporulation sigma factor SigK [Clostridia bacterium]